MYDYDLNSLICYQRLQNQEEYHLYDGLSNQHYLVSEKEITFLSMLEKNYSLSELEANSKYTQAEIISFMEVFESIGLLNPTKKKSFLRVNVSKVKKSSTSIVLEKLCFIFLIIGGIIAVAFSTFFSMSEYVSAWKSIEEQNLIFLFIQVFLITVVSILIHEIGHFLFAINRGLLVPTISLNIKKGLVSVDTTGIQFLQELNDKIAILFAGPLFNLVLSLYSFLGGMLAGETKSFWLLVSVINFLFFIQNMCLLFSQSDGQKILTELTQSSLIADNMNIFYFFKNMNDLNLQRLCFFLFLWSQKIVLVAMLIIAIAEIFE
ncbi:hypothetical protein JZO66_08095 [Enterococcus sp. DIV0242_7C1]|uniref:Peptidase M50 domain-containing protein n=1 Tax=Candidatus Enterococcus dunnyi TaxID=1834192 RepID=A0A200JDA3_9ENTE|nr:MULTISPECIES: hypothetical protein [unclassified Enterococcus]MBO0470504.1 hypothetical protein [Enterococcus sp. DIV0242_7C1]OUZ34841.1 hypothetical protein A5889_000316 [Enterococcus sp. 9D6_DIV0238]